MKDETKGKEISEKKLGLFMITPTMLIILVTAVIPIIYVLYLSTQDIRGIMNQGFVGLQNYKTIIESGNLQSALVATFLFGFGAIIFQMVAAMIIALALNVDFKGKNVVRSLILI
ncbi:MAG: carbohydrate ABC transporter permease, partial [Halarsenatibacteraceae bacterium]